MQRGNGASIYALEIGIYARLRLFLWDLVGGARQRPHLAVLAAAPQNLVSLLLLLPDGLVLAYLLLS